MKKTINLFWFKYSKGHGNFGDELNHYIISRLSPLQIKHIDPHSFSHSPFVAFKAIIYKVIFAKGALKEIAQFPEWNTIFGKKIIFAIGSIIGYYTTNNIVVWGSGIISRDDIITDADFRAVRGKYTQNRILELDYKSDAVLGDPALLLPLLFKPNVTQKYLLGIIPHYIHYDNLVRNFESDNIKIINLLAPIEEVLNDINSCDFTISTSLHGIIVSHCYGIKSLWVNFSEISDILLDGDNIKFYDYFSSVDVPENPPIEIESIKALLENNLIIENLSHLAFIPESAKIREIQANLLRRAPFKLRKDLMEEIIIMP